MPAEHNPWIYSHLGVLPEDELEDERPELNAGRFRSPENEPPRPPSDQLSRRPRTVTANREQKSVSVRTPTMKSPVKQARTSKTKSAKRPKASLKSIAMEPVISPTWPLGASTTVVVLE